MCPVDSCCNGRCGNSTLQGSTASIGCTIHQYVQIHALSVTLHVEHHSQDASSAQATCDLVCTKLLLPLLLSVLLLPLHSLLLKSHSLSLLLLMLLLLMLLPLPFLSLLLPALLFLLLLSLVRLGWLLNRGGVCCQELWLLQHWLEERGSAPGDPTGCWGWSWGLGIWPGECRRLEREQILM